MAEYEVDELDADDYWPDDDPQPREEPHCYPCGDSGFVGRRNCADCNPTRLQHWWWLRTWRIRAAFRVIRWRLAGRPTDGEAPF